MVAGAIWRMHTRIPSELCNQQLLIPPKVDIRLVLTRSKDRFSPLSSQAANTFKVIITDAQLRVRKVKLDSEFRLAHGSVLL